MPGRPKIHRHAFGFGALEPPAQWKTARVCVVPLPYDSTATFQAGARFGPDAVFRASKSLELYDSDLGMETCKIGIFTADEVEPNINSPFENSQVVEAAVADVLKARKFPVALGGDHSVSLGCVRAVRKKCPDIGFLVFDAHPDLYDEFEGTRYGHANVTRRIHELGVPVALLGIRSAGRDEMAYAKKFKLPVVAPREIMKSPDALDRALAALPDRIYLSIDLDVLDPGEMPSVGTPEPGGIHWYELIDALARIAGRKRIVAFDLVELCPIAGLVAPDFLAAKLLYRLLGLIFRQ